MRLVCDCGRPLVKGRCPVCDGALSRPGRRASATRRAQLAREASDRGRIGLAGQRSALGAKVAALDPLYKQHRDDVTARRWKRRPAEEG